MQKISHIFPGIGSGTTPASGNLDFYNDGIIPWLNTGDLNDGILLSCKKQITSLAKRENGLKLYKKNSIVVAMYGATIGKVSLLKFDTTVNQACCVIPSSPKYYSKYFLYWFLAKKSDLILMGSGGGQPNINQDIIKALRFSFPERSGQKSIADYLDTETGKIDQKIAGLEKKAVLYKELKQSLINETVTRGLPAKEAQAAGLTPNPPMKDSGIPWIGEIPEHWEVKRIGTAFEERSDRVNDTDYPPLSVTMKGIVPQLANAAKTQHNDNRKKVCEGDYVINSRSDRRGSSGISPLEGSVSVINIVLKPVKKTEGAYLHYLFRSYRFIEEFYRNGRGIVDDLWTTKYDFMRAIQCSFPSDLKEQKAIATYLDRKTQQIDKILLSIEQQINTLKELRKTLINDVVTGKICVTDTH